MVRSPGFEPGLSAWQADVLTKLDYDRDVVFWLLFCISIKLGFWMRRSFLLRNPISTGILVIIKEKIKRLGAQFRFLKFSF